MLNTFLSNFRRARRRIVEKEGGRRRKRICGMNVWVIVALIIFLIIGAIVGGIVGAIKGRDTAATSEARVSPITRPLTGLPNLKKRTATLLFLFNSSSS